MSGLAEILRSLEFDVSGSDMRESDTTRRLQTLGVRIDIGHELENISGVDVVVYSSAIRPENPELTEARALGIPVINPGRDARRADARQIRRRDRGVAREDDDDVARRHRAPSRRPRSDRGRRREDGGARIRTRALAPAISWSPRPTRATDRSSASPRRSPSSPTSIPSTSITTAPTRRSSPRSSSSRRAFPSTASPSSASITRTCKTSCRRCSAGTSPTGSRRRAITARAGSSSAASRPASTPTDAGNRWAASPSRCPARTTS